MRESDLVIEVAGGVYSGAEAVKVRFIGVVGGLFVLDDLLGRLGRGFGELCFKFGDTLVAFFDSCFLRVGESVSVVETLIEGIVFVLGIGLGFGHLCMGFGVKNRSDSCKELAKGTFLILFGKRYVRYRHTLGSHSGGERVGQARSRFIFKVGDFINEAPVEGFLSREPTAYFHQREQVFGLALAAVGIELGAVKVELIKVSLNLFAVGN